MSAGAARVGSAMSDAAGTWPSTSRTVAGRRPATSIDYGAAATARRARAMGSRTVDYVQDQPLLLGALGLSVGAVIGILLPASRYERRVAGTVRERLGEAAREAVGDARDRAMRVADTVLDAAQKPPGARVWIRPRGGVGAATREQVADVAGRARRVVEETAAAGRGAVEREVAPEVAGTRRRDRMSAPRTPAAGERMTTTAPSPDPDRSDVYRAGRASPARIASGVGGRSRGRARRGLAGRDPRPGLVAGHAAGLARDRVGPGLDGGGELRVLRHAGAVPGDLGPDLPLWPAVRSERDRAAARRHPRRPAGHGVRPGGAAAARPRQPSGHVAQLGPGDRHGRRPVECLGRHQVADDCPEHRLRGA